MTGRGGGLGRDIVVFISLVRTVWAVRANTWRLASGSSLMS